MLRETRTQYNALLTAMAAAYGGEGANPLQVFTATVPQSQKLNDKIQESSAFLQQISIIPVDDIKGEVVTMEIPSTVAKRTNVGDDNPRKPTIIGNLTDRKYECSLTEFDVGIAYALLDAWARYPDFRSRYMKAIYKRIALDRILIGWHGTSAAAATDNVANPNLEDVNKGWLYDLETNNAANFVTEVVEASGAVTIGEAGDYQTIDQMVYDIGTLIPDEHKTGAEVAIVGKALVAADMNKILSVHSETPSEKIHFEILGKSFGGYRSVTVPGFPDHGVLITDPKNLQIYLQRTSLRRKNEDQPAYNRIVDFISQNEAYMVGDLEAAAGVASDSVAFV